MLRFFFPDLQRNNSFHFCSFLVFICVTEFVFVTPRKYLVCRLDHEGTGKQFEKKVK